MHPLKWVLEMPLSDKLTQWEMGLHPATNEFWLILRASGDKRFGLLLCNTNDKAEANLVAKTLAVDFFIGAAKSGRANICLANIRTKKCCAPARPVQ